MQFQWTEVSLATQDFAPLPWTREAHFLFYYILVVILWILVVFPLRMFPSTVTLSALALPVALVVGLLIAIRVARAGTAGAPAILVVPGVFVIVAGAIFDMAATVYHSPDLGRENNPIARLLLDSGYSVGTVYGFAVLCQGLYLGLLSTLWIGLLKHREFLVASLREERSFWRFFKAATGGKALTWRQWFLPLRLSEMPEGRTPSGSSPSCGSPDPSTAGISAASGWGSCPGCASPRLFTS
jgi:hypothetical protein